MFMFRNCWESPVPGGVCSSKPCSFSSTCKNLRSQHPPPQYGLNMVFQKRRFKWVQTHTSNLVDSGSKITGREHKRNRVYQTMTCLSDVGYVYPFWRYIRNQSLKLSKVDPNCARFRPQIFLGQGPPNFSTWIGKLNTLQIMWQSLGAITWGSSEILGWKKWKKKPQKT